LPLLLVQSQPGQLMRNSLGSSLLLLKLLLSLSLLLLLLLLLLQRLFIMLLLLLRLLLPLQKLQARQLHRVCGCRVCHAHHPQPEAAGGRHLAAQRQQQAVMAAWEGQVALLIQLHPRLSGCTGEEAGRQGASRDG
jgi:hypothetical protein